MAEDRPGALDPRFPEVFQRAGASTPGLRPPGVPPMPSADRSGYGDRRARGARPVLDDGVASAGGQPLGERPPARPGATSQDRPERVYEIVAAGNPWLRGMWVLGTVVMLVGVAFQWIAQTMFSTPPPTAQTDYVLPQVLFALSNPLITAGAIALIATASLRMAAWRPRSRREVDPG